MSLRSTYLWRHPEWWAIGLCALAWICLVYGAIAAGGHHHVHTLSAATIHWLLMIAAMMFPLLVGHIRVVASRSLWRRRNRAIAAYLCGYLVPWIAFGAGVYSVLGTPWTPVVLLVAAAWQLTRWKRLGLYACHRTEPLAPSGWRADWDCVRYGWNTAGYCLLSCWALMLACAGNLFWMAALMAFTILERTADRPRQVWYAGALALSAVAIGIFA